MSNPPALECQACGDVVRVLTPTEAQQVAANPYNYIVYCRAHHKEATESWLK